MINQSERPAIYFGGGVAAADAGAALLALMNKASIPATRTLMASGVLSYDEPKNLGLLGMHGSRTANLAVDEADLVLALGTRFSDRVALNTDAFARNAKIVQIDIDQSEINKNVEVALGVVGDIGHALERLLPMVEEKHHPQWWRIIADSQAADYTPEDDGYGVKAAPGDRQNLRTGGGRFHHRNGRGAASDVGGAILQARENPQLFDKRRPWHHGLRLRRGVGRAGGISG